MCQLVFRRNIVLVIWVWGEFEVGVVDDLSVEGEDDELLVSDFDDRGDVDVGVLFGADVLLGRSRRGADSTR